MVGGYFTDEKGLIHQEYIAVQPGTLTQLTTLPLLADLRPELALQGICRLRQRHRAPERPSRYRFRRPLQPQQAGGRARSAKGALAGGSPIASNRPDVVGQCLHLLAGARSSSSTRTARSMPASPRAIRPGGPNVIPPSAPAGTPATFAPDKVTSYEAGFKGESADRRLTLDVAAYHIDWKGIQLLTVVNNFGINANGANAKSDGVEFNATARLEGGLTLSANGAYTDARLAGDTSALVGGKKGDQLPFTPKLSLGFNGDYSWSIGDKRPMSAPRCACWASRAAASTTPIAPPTATSVRCRPTR
jgi:iron complex outermembrane receptor protein